MSIKYFCDNCDKQIVLDLTGGLEVERGSDWIAYQHEQGVETIFYDSPTDERTQSHQCKKCHIEKALEGESYYD
jgi:hypothetical protein